MFRKIGLLVACCLVSICRAGSSGSSSSSSSDRKIKLPEDREGQIEDFFLLSVDHPSKISFRPSQSKSFKVEALVERLNADATLRSVCSFPAFGYESASYHIKLRSLDNEYELFQIIKIFPQEPRNNSMEIFVVDMRDCRHTRTELLKGYDYFKSGASFLVLRPGDSDKLDVFSFDGDAECGSYMCKRVFSVPERSLGPATRFPLLTDQRDWTVKFMAASVDEGYFAITRKDEIINILSLNKNGEVVSSLNNNTEARVHLLKISTRNGMFGFCYTTKTLDREVHCIQLDERMRALINVTTDVGYVTQDIAVHNLARTSTTGGGGLLLLTISCPNRNDRCEEHEVNVLRFDPLGQAREFARFRDPGCAPRWQQQFNFFEDESGRVCLYYACDYLKPELKHKKDVGYYDKLVRSRCF